MTRVERRSDWGALPPKSDPGGFITLEATVCHYTAANYGYAVPITGDHERCRNQVRSIQRQHQAISNQSDIEYNALVCNHGVVFEGRVLGYRGGANGTAESNRTMPSICCLLGIDDEPSEAMKDSVAWFHSRVEDRANRALRMKKHMEIVSTTCPGRPMSTWIDADGYLRLPVPDPGPQEDDMFARRFRFKGFWNVFLMGAGPIQPVTPEINANYDATGAPPVIVCDWHEQTVEAITKQCGTQVWVPSGE